LRFGFFQRGLDVAELRSQRPQHVRCRRQGRFLLLQDDDFGCQRGPVEFREIGMDIELGQRVRARLEARQFGPDAGDQAADIAQRLFELPRLRFQRGDLGDVGPPEHIAAAIVQVMTVVFFMPLTPRLDLPIARDGMGLPAELLLGSAAGDVEAVGNLAFEPVIERRIRLDRELAHQRIAARGLRLGTATRTHPEVDDAPFQSGFFHPSRHLRVVYVRHQQ